MTSQAEHEALRESYRRLRAAAERVLEASSYPTADGEQSKVYASQLRALRRELEGVPQSSAFATMSIS